jgi:hypothetical protein
MSLQAIKAQAHIHHAYLLGLQLMISSRLGPDVMEDWMFRLFRRQHLDKFLSSFEKLGLSAEPDAVACAKYHVLSNSIGGVPVEYMAESDSKAWLRFRYPRWMYHGPTICGIPVGVSRGFLRGWYAYNGVSLGNPRLGFVCVSEDMTGEFGLCGYFREYDHVLSEEERLQFARDELPPAFKDEDQPKLPEQEWHTERLEKANRNYALDYIRNGLPTLAEVIGTQKTIELGGLAARLIGLQYYSETGKMLGAIDNDLASAFQYIRDMMAGLGDSVKMSVGSSQEEDQLGVVRFEQSGLRMLRDLNAEDRSLVLSCWSELWVGAVKSHQQMMDLKLVNVEESRLVWTLRSAGLAAQC